MTNLEKIAETAERDAWEDMVTSVNTAWADKVGLKSRRIGSGVAISFKGLDFVLFNRVIGLGIDSPTTQNEIGECQKIYGELGIKNYALQMAPQAQPAETQIWLAGAGLREGFPWAKVIRDKSRPKPIPTDFEIRPCGRDDAAQFSATVCAAFEMPPFLAPMSEGLPGRPGWYCYLAWEGRQPVAAAAMYINNKVAWMGVAATKPEKRNRGAQGALLVRRIEEAIQAGCQWMVTETGADTPGNPNPSYHNMLRTGFKLQYLRDNYCV